MKTEKREVVVSSWSGGIEGAVRGPFRAIVWEEVPGPPLYPGGKPFPVSRELFKCQHRHATMDEAFTCGKAALK